MATEETTSRKSRMNALRPALLVIVLLGIAGYFVAKKAANQPPQGVLIASGSIEANETTISPKVSGRLLTLKVDEGFEVHRGDLLATLDDTELAAQLGQAEASLSAAQAKLDAAIHGNRPEQIVQAEAQLKAAKSTAVGSRKNAETAQRNILSVLDLKSQLDIAEYHVPLAEAAYTQALASLNLLRQGTRPKQVDEVKAALAQAQVNLTKAEIDFQRMKTLADQGAVAIQSLDNTKAIRDADKKLVDQAQARLDDLLAGPRQSEIHQSEMAVAQANAHLVGARTSLTNARQAYRDRLSAQSQLDSQSANAGAAEAQVTAAQAQLDLLKAGTRAEDIANLKSVRDQAQKAVEYAKAMVANTYLYAPNDGVIKTKDALLGETLSPGTPVVTIADLDHIWIRVFVPEDKYGVLKLGQSVDVKVDSFPHEKFRGQIVSIASEAEFTPKNAQTPEERVKLVFGVKISVNNPARKLKPGMPGDAWIHID